MECGNRNIYYMNHKFCGFRSCHFRCSDRALFVETATFPLATSCHLFSFCARPVAQSRRVPVLKHAMACSWRFIAVCCLLPALNGGLNGFPWPEAEQSVDAQFANRTHFGTRERWHFAKGRTKQPRHSLRLVSEVLKEVINLYKLCCMRDVSTKAQSLQRGWLRTSHAGAGT